MTNAEIDKKIASIKANSHLSEGIKKVKIAQLEKEKTSEGKSKPPTAKAEKKPTTTKTKAPASPKKKPAPTKHKSGGKDLSELSCEELLAAAEERLKQAKKSGKKYRTKPVIEKIGADIAQAVKHAVKNIPVDDLKDNPEKWKKKILAAIEAGKEYARKLKEILGVDYDASTITDELKPLKEFAEMITKKYK